MLLHSHAIVDDRLTWSWLPGIFAQAASTQRVTDGAANVEAALPLAAATARQSLKGAGADEQGKQEV